MFRATELRDYVRDVSGSIENRAANHCWMKLAREERCGKHYSNSAASTAGLCWSGRCWSQYGEQLKPLRVGKYTCGRSLVLGRLKSCVVVAHFPCEKRCIVRRRRTSAFHHVPELAWLICTHNQAYNYDYKQRKSDHYASPGKLDQKSTQRNLNQSCS